MSIEGFRGFAQAQSIHFALPDGNTCGSGLTFITGSNNSGKTTIIESIRAFNGSDSPSFSEGRRNASKNGKVRLSLFDENDIEYYIATTQKGGSQTESNKSRYGHLYYVVPSRRSASYEFQKGNNDRDFYIKYGLQLEKSRSSELGYFNERLFQIFEDKQTFDQLLRQVLGYDFDWTIELRDSGQYYVKYYNNGLAHSAEGVGDGIWSIFTICAALYESFENDTVIIDEPELSIHPALQRRLCQLLVSESKKRQIIIATHSPYFIDWDAIANGAELVRVVKTQIECKVHALSPASRKSLHGLRNDLHNVRTLGVEATEALFLEDRIILVEGQDDVVAFKRIAQELEMPLEGELFGWGVGGAPKMRFFMGFFKDLGFKRVVAVLDNDQGQLADKIREEYGQYGFEVVVIPTDDIRDKEQETLKSKVGIVNSKYDIKDEYRDDTIRIINTINNGLRSV